jgi:hypothetical protein
MAGIAGVTAIETKAAGVTMSVVDPPMEPDAADTFVFPTATLVAFPCAFMVAIVESAVFHVVVAVKSWVLPSEKVPVAKNCRLVPRAMEGFWGETAIETRVAGVTVSVVDPVMDPEAAVTVVLPIESADATPWLFIVATLGFVVVQVAVVVKSWVLPSLYEPVAFRG